MILFWWAPYPIHLFSLANFDAWCQNCDVYTVQWLRLRQMFSITCGSLLLMGEIWLTFKGWRWLTSCRSYRKCHHSQNFKIWERAWCIGCRTNLIITHHFVRVSSPSCDSTMSWCIWLLFNIMAFESHPAEQAFRWLYHVTFRTLSCFAGSSPRVQVGTQDSCFIFIERT